MTQALKDDFIRFEDYLAGEREVEFRSEYVDGLAYAMAGASETHNTIAGSFCALIEARLKDGCRVWQSDMKLAVRNRGQNFGYYPDIMAACGENTGDPYTRTDPILIVEVLADSTERVDLKEKFDNYASIPTLLEYVVVAQDVPLVRLFRRRTSWERETYRAEDVFRFGVRGVGCSGSACLSTSKKRGGAGCRGRCSYVTARRADRRSAIRQTQPSSLTTGFGLFH